MSNRQVRSRANAALVLSLACSFVGTSVAASADMNWDVDLSTDETRRGAVSDSVRASTDGALREAVHDKQSQTVRLLLDAGADPNVVNQNREPVLVEAVKEKQEEIVTLLLEAGADPGALNQNKVPVIVEAIQHKREKIVELLLEHGADPSSKNENREPVLVQAVKDKQEQIARLLLERGADPNSRDQNRRPVLIEAVRNKQTAIVELLLSYGARSDLQDQNGGTALSVAVKKKQRRMVEMLLEQTTTAGRQPIERPKDQSHRAATTQKRAPPPEAPPIRAGDSLYSKRVAVVIGINDYTHWPALEGARSDARRVSERMRALGFDEVVEIYDEKATRRNLLTVLGLELAKRTDENSLAMIYFAGHGQTETLPGGQKRGYIIPVDADREQVYSTAISMDQLRDLSNRLPARQVYYVMDSCYSGLGLVRGLTVMNRTGGYLRKVTGMRSVQMITAGLEGEMATESGGRGLFTSYFLRALTGEADFDGDGYVTASEIGTYVRPQVSSASRQRQTPQFGSLEGQGEVALPVFFKPR
jgi:hypothetical protein